MTIAHVHCTPPGDCTVQGDCAAPPPASSNSSVSACLRARQCVITCQSGFLLSFEAWDGEPNRGVWLHGLQLVSSSRSSTAILATARARVWLSQVSVFDFNTGVGLKGGGGLFAQGAPEVDVTLCNGARIRFDRCCCLWNALLPCRACSESGVCMRKMQVQVTASLYDVCMVLLK